MTDAPTTESENPAPPRTLRRCPHHRVVAGVAAGVADYLDLDVTLVRLAFVLLTIAAGVGVPAYLAAWVLVPEEGAARSVAEDLTARWSQP